MAGRRSKAKTRKAPQTQHDRAGTQFPVGRIKRYLRDMQLADRIGAKAAVMLAGVLEYLCLEVLELAGVECEKDGFQRVKPNHLQKAVYSDDELSKLMYNTTLSNAGTKQHIEPELLRKTGKAATQTQ